MRLVIFDADGTLINSQAIILEGINLTFREFGHREPSVDAVLATIGLTLDLLFAKLLGRSIDEEIRAMCVYYKKCHMGLLQVPRFQSQLYEGIDETIGMLASQPETLLAIATGKSRRGLERMIETFGYEGKFVALRTADDCPSKPHPAMILECCEISGCDFSQTVMIGDSNYDMQMAVQAGTKALGVSWGYQSVEALVQAGANAIVDRPCDIPDAINQILNR
ncbi:MAG: HAD-IA family hydrolase [Hyphomicrobiales bacterium]|nr:HAD-IA family hydrolase [Hyphomicrobiales bacterium]